jgi:hypothetical protein
MDAMRFKYGQSNSTLLTDLNADLRGFVHCGGGIHLAHEVTA